MTLAELLVDHPDIGPDTQRALARRANPLLDRRGLDDVISALGGIGVIDQLLNAHDITEIMINGPGPVRVERAGRIETTDHIVTAHDIALIVERVLGPLGLRSDRLAPIVDARLADGSRINVVAPPLAVDGPVLSIRRFASTTLPLDAFGPAGMIDVLTALMTRRARLLVVGPTSSGKTTMLNTLAAHIRPGERIVTIEDTAELRFDHPHVVRLEARPANSEGVGEVPLRRLVTTALRMRPDRIVVGEVRGPEAFDLLLALTAGHSGSLATCHAADAPAGLRRLQLLACLAHPSLSPDHMGRFVVDAIDAVVNVERLDDGKRVVRSISAVPDLDTETLWSR